MNAERLAQGVALATLIWIMLLLTSLLSVGLIWLIIHIAKAW